MKYKKTLLIVCLLACVIFSISGVMAGDAGENAVANEDQQQITQSNGDMDLSSSSPEDVISSEDASLISESSDDNVISKSSESNVLSASSGDNTVKSDSGATSNKAAKSALIVSAPKVINTYKKGTFKVTVKDKKTKKPVKGIKLKIKVYTGKKSKIYSVKTNKNGIAKISTKKLSKGTHKVVVKVKATKKYKGKTVKSSIKIQTKSSSNNKGKISTSITADYTLTTRSKERVNRYAHGTFSTYVQYPYISIKPTLEGADGKKISGEYEAIVYYYTGNDYQLLKTETFKGKYGEVTRYSGTPAGWDYQIVIKYKGNSKYAPCEFSRYFG